MAVAVDWGLMAAGVAAVPPLLVLVATFPVLLVASAPAAYLLLTRHQTNHKKKNRTQQKGEEEDDDDKSPPSIHIIITGGSSGIGLGVARHALALAQIAEKNKNKTAKHHRIQKVTLLARDRTKLEKARSELQALNASVQVRAMSVDVSDYAALQRAATTLFDTVGGDPKVKTPTTKGKTDDSADPTSSSSSSPSGESTVSCSRVLLFCCAGEAHPQYFAKLHPDIFLQQIQVNQLGCTYAAHVFVPHLLQAKHGGTICFCSSAAGQVGVFGLAAYSPTKFAIRGLAEALHSELLDTNVHVQVAFPPDTDTPGFVKENETKPPECHAISATLKLANPNIVGKSMLESALQSNPPFQIYFDFDGFLLSTLTCGFGPVTTFFDAWVQVSGLSTIVRWVALLYLRSWHSIIRRCRSDGISHENANKVNKDKQGVVTMEKKDTTEKSGAAGGTATKTA